MLPRVEEKLHSLVAGSKWDDILLAYEENGVSCVGICEIYGHNDEDHIGISWSENPVIVADDLASLEKYLSQLLVLVREGLVVTEKELEQFNCQFPK